MIKTIAFILVTLFSFSVINIFKLAGVLLYIKKFNSISPLLQIELDFQKEYVFVIRPNNGSDYTNIDNALTIRRTMEYFYTNYGAITVLFNFRYIVENEINMYFALISDLKDIANTICKYSQY